MTKNIYAYLNTDYWMRLTEISPTTGFSSSLPGKTQQHPMDPYLLGMPLWPANHQTITTTHYKHHRQTSRSEITTGCHLHWQATLTWNCQQLKHQANPDRYELWPLYRSICISQYPIKVGRILLVQSFTAHMPLLMATTTFGLKIEC